MKLSTQDIAKEFKEKSKLDFSKELDNESALAIFNGLVVSYLKANGEYNKSKETALKEGLRKVILSLPKYKFGYKGVYETGKEGENYLALCPKELIASVSCEEIDEGKVFSIAERVIKISAQNGIDEKGKMTLPDRNVSLASMGAFTELDASIEPVYDLILATGGEEAMARTIEIYKKTAKKAVDDEIEFHIDNTNYIVKFYSNILIHAQETEDEGASI